MKKYLFIIFLLNFSGLLAKNQMEDSIISIDLGEIVIIKDYVFANLNEVKQYKVLEEDLNIIYPLLLIVRKDYVRINKELELYEGDREKEFLKWYEKYAKENYMHYLSALNIRQGRLFLKLISRELNFTPYNIIKQYRNGMSAVLWQAVANFYLSSLKTEYTPDSNPMIEHIMRRIENQYG